VAALGNPYPTHQSLPWGEAEALTLAHLGGDPSRAAIQYEADRTHLLEMLRTAQVVDVSSHGIAANDYLQSRLLLANGESLTLADALNETITDMHGLRLLILSACQTAILSLEGAPDEVRSLAAGMLQAGARAVLASLWPVDDRATYLLIVRFAQEWFPHMETEPPAAALARAQRWLRTVTNRELQSWQATEPLPSIIASAQNQPETQVATLTRDATFSPGRGTFSPGAGEQKNLTFGQRYSVQDAEQILQEVAQRWAQEGEPEARPYADPFYWAGFQLYGW
jgi:CHAT domain-containing protein